MGLAKEIVLAVLAKISNLLIQESDSLLGVEDQMQWFESCLRENADFHRPNKEILRPIIYDLEYVIYELIDRSSQRRRRDDFIRNVLVSYNLPKHFFYILALFDLIHLYKLRMKLQQLKLDIPAAFCSFLCAGSWGSSFDLYNQEIGNNRTISPLVTEFQIMARQRHLTQAVRKQSMWLRDEFRSLQRSLQQFEAAEESDEKLVWLEELWDVCRAAKNVIGMFMDEQQQHNSIKMKGKGTFIIRNLLWTSYNLINFMSQHKFSKRLALIKNRATDLSDNATGVVSKVIKTEHGTIVMCRRAWREGRFRPRKVIQGGDADEDANFNAPTAVQNGNDEDIDATAGADEHVDANSSALAVQGNGGIVEGSDESNSEPSTSVQHRLDEGVEVSSEHPKAIEVNFDGDVDVDASVSIAEGIFDEDVDAIIQELLKMDPRCLTISIVGVRGIGKTSLAKLIFDNQIIVHHFPQRIWMSPNQYHPWNHTMKLTKDFFENTRKSLFVLEGSYAGTFWKIIERKFRDESNGCRIIFTFDNLQQALPITEVDFTYRLHLRSDEESWALFTYILKVNIPRELEKNMKKVILRKCGGLPKSIVKLGRALSQSVATVEEWSKVLNQLDQYVKPWSQVLTEINKTLPLYLRRCLFYFGLFPVDYNIPARRLIALWVAEDLGRCKQDDEKSLEYIAEASLKELINCNMVQVTRKKLDGKARTCCLPEPLRLHWFSKASKATFLHHNQSDSGTNSTSLIIPAVRRLADHLNPKDATIFDHIHGNSNSISLCPYYRNVVSFLSFDTREGSRAGEDVENFLNRCITSGGFHFLWLLDLENVYKPKLPKAVGKLTRLKYFGLRSTYLEMLPMFIDKLLNLQTLDLKRTCINTLPNLIWKMQKLRHLFLDESFCTMFVPRQDDNSLDDLQTLWGVFIDENSPVKGSLDTLSNITKLGLKSKISVPSRKEAMTSQLEAVANWVMNLKSLQCLRLKSFDESGQPWDLHLESLMEHKDLTSVYLVGKLKNQQLVYKFPNSLTELALSGARLIEDDPMQVLDKLPNLRVLRLLARSFMGKKMVCCYGGFPKLQVLKLWELELLEEWVVEEGALLNLKDLEIRHCMNLKMIPDGLQHVKSLREFKLNKMPELSTRIKDRQGGDWNKIAHVRQVNIQDY